MTIKQLRVLAILGLIPKHLVESWSFRNKNCDPIALLPEYYTYCTLRWAGAISLISGFGLILFGLITEGLLAGIIGIIFAIYGQFLCKEHPSLKFTADLKRLAMYLRDEGYQNVIGLPIDQQRKIAKTAMESGVQSIEYHKQRLGELHTETNSARNHLKNLHQTFLMFGLVDENINKYLANHPQMDKPVSEMALS